MSFDLLILALKISCKIVLGIKAVCLKRDRNHASLLLLQA